MYCVLPILGYISSPYHSSGSNVPAKSDFVLLTILLDIAIFSKINVSRSVSLHIWSNGEHHNISLFRLHDILLQKPLAKKEGTYRYSAYIPTINGWLSPRMGVSLGKDIWNFRRSWRVQLDYHVIRQNCAKDWKRRGNRTAEWVSPLRATQMQKPAASS